MNINIKCCDLCHAPIKGDKHGIVITLGRSLGGWGRREDLLNWSGEVCPKCHEEYSKIAAAAAVWIEKRGGCRAPTIIITEHDVSTMPSDESSPGGREAPLLR
jgi:hypothetical protein